MRLVRLLKTLISGAFVGAHKQTNSLSVDYSLAGEVKLCQPEIGLVFLWDFEVEGDYLLLGKFFGLGLADWLLGFGLVDRLEARRIHDRSDTLNRLYWRLCFLLCGVCAAHRCLL